MSTTKYLLALLTIVILSFTVGYITGYVKGYNNLKVKQSELFVVDKVETQKNFTYHLHSGKKRFIIHSEKELYYQPNDTLKILEKYER